MFILVGYLNLTNCNRKKFFTKSFSNMQHQPFLFPLQSLMEGGTKSSGLLPRKAPTMPKPQWHPPWKLYRVRALSTSRS